MGKYVEKTGSVATPSELGTGTPDGTTFLRGDSTWATPSGGGAPTGAKYIVQEPDAGLSAEQALSALGTGLLKNTTGTGILTIAAAGTDFQAPDADLTTIAGLTATTDSFMQSKASAWAARTIAQVKTDLGLTGTNSGDQASIVGITGTTAQFNTALTDGDFATGGGTATGSNTGDQTISDATISTTDITTNNATTAKHGFLSKLPGGTATFLRADGAFASPTASASISQTEIDFGTTPVAEASFLITDAAVSAASRIIGTVAYVAPTGKDLDELEMDGLDLKFAPGSGQFTLYARGLDGYVADKFLVNYSVGA